MSSSSKINIPSTGIAIVDVWAPWCGPCRMMTPILEEIKNERNIELIKINVEDRDENPEIPSFLAEHQITSIPYIMLYKDGVLKDTVIGSMNKKSFLQHIERL